VLTHTLSVGVVHRTAVDRVLRIVFETYDGVLNDIRGQHVTSPRPPPPGS
jgi:L-aminopeptidase/D-esterase-like protein